MVKTGVEAMPQPSRRADRTREMILAAGRELFLDKGYAGTSVHAIAAASGISRAGFYNYFKDKREVFGVLGDLAYRDLRRVLDERLWRGPAGHAQVEGFVEAYFDYMDRHGAFALAAAASAPDDDGFRRGNQRMHTRICWQVGESMTVSRSHSPEVAGAAILGLLDRSWDTVRTGVVNAGRGEMIELLTDMLVMTAAANTATSGS